MPGLQSFEREATRIRREQLRLSRALDAREAEFFAKEHVTGFGIGRKNNKPVVRFFVDRKVALSKLSAKNRIPRRLVFGKQTISTDVVAIGSTPSLFTTTIGDPTQNDVNYHVDGVGTWDMGTMITVFIPGTLMAGAMPIGSGTSGCLVKQRGGSGGPWMMSCEHVLFKDQFDVAQHNQDRVPGVGQPLHNFVGGVREISRSIAYADAGLVECEDASNVILNIGAPKEQQTAAIYDGIYVQKSGATTGVTWGQVTAALVRHKINNPMFAPSSPLSSFIGRNLFFITNSCTQNPANPGVIAPGALNKFAAAGDSGSLIVLGKTDSPGTFNTPGEGLQKKYDSSKAADQASIVAKYDKAALGLLIAGNPKMAIGQEIDYALNQAFTVQLDLVL